MGPQTLGHAPSPHPKPWSLPLASTIPSTLARLWHRRIIEVHDNWQSGVGGDHDFLSAQRSLSVVSINLQHAYSVDKSSPALKPSFAMLRRVMSHDLLETALLHGKARLDELMRVGEKIILFGAKFDPRTIDFASRIPLAQASETVQLPKESLEQLAYSIRYLSLRSQMWATRFPYKPYQVPHGPASTRRIRALASQLGSEDFRKVYEVAVTLGSLSRDFKQRLLELATPSPCTPYAQAVSVEFEESYKAAEFAGWRLRKQIEPDGERHRSSAFPNVQSLPVCDQVFMHRLVRYRIDALRRIGSAQWRELEIFGRQFIGQTPNTDQRVVIDSSNILSHLPRGNEKIHFPVSLLRQLSDADHNGWRDVLRFSNSIGDPNLAQPGGAKRGDGADDANYGNLPSHMQSRVALNVLSRTVSLWQNLQLSDLRYLESALIRV